MVLERKTLGNPDLALLFENGTLPSGDRALLDRFVARRDEAAFERLVFRHGPMVRGVCRRLLIDPNDIDDAFQATFLVLVLKAAGIRNPERLGPWLFGVATRVAKKARARRGRHLALVGDLSGPHEPGDLADVRPILDAELSRLPSRIRDVLVLCLLEGATAEEAAARLACPLGTVKSRLARGREALRSRLIARGIAPAIALAAVSTTFAAPVSTALVRATVSSVTATQVSPALFMLTQGALPAMFSRPLILATLVLGGFSLTGLGAVEYLRAQTHAPAAQPAAAQAQEPTPKDAETSRNPEPQDQADQPATDPPQTPIPNDAVARRNLKTICLAIHNYNDAYGNLPPSAISGGGGSPKLSWRVALLPLLDEGSLYGEFKLDESWDSPHNKKLVDRMPAVFQAPNDPAPPGRTYIRTFVGKGALFEPNQKISLADVTDGPANTLAVAVAEQAVEWTRPDDLSFVEGEALPQLRRADPRGWLIGTADATVRNLQPDNDFLRRIITRAGGEPITWPPVTIGQPLPTPPE